MNVNGEKGEAGKIMSGLVSVVIPSYNHAHFLMQTLQSVIDQTYTNWEALVIDNHSEDNTDSVVNSFKDTRIKLLKINNGGVIAASRNLGIQHAQGEWVAFLDSDDYWYPEKLEISTQVLMKGAKLVCHAEDWIKNGTILRTVQYGPKNKATYRHLLYGKNCISTSAVTVLRDSLLTVGGFTEAPQAIGIEDYHLWLKLAKAENTIEFIEQTLGCFRIYGMSHSSNLVRQMNSEKWVLKENFKALSHMSVIDHILKCWRFGRLYTGTAFHYLIKSIS